MLGSPSDGSKWQHGDRRELHPASGSGGNTASAATVQAWQPQRICVYWVLQILQPHVTEIFKRPLTDTARFLEQGSRDNDAAGRRDGLQADREVDAAAIHIIEIEDHRLPMDADPKRDTALGRLRALMHRHFALKLRGAADRVEWALEHRDEA